MRRHSRRVVLPKATARRLDRETRVVANASNPAQCVRNRWDTVRRAKWFRKVIDSLRRMAGDGEPCMYCDSNESAEVEHFKPKAVFPERAFDWENFLWVCGLCNRYQGDQYPPVTQNGAEILNPLDTDPWEHMFVDDLTGLLSGTWCSQSGSRDERAESTIEIVNLNREALQERRRQRIVELKQFVLNAMRQIDAGTATREKLLARIREYLTTAYHPDVSDYFLAGPGKATGPFKSFFKRIENEE